MTSYSWWLSKDVWGPLVGVLLGFVLAASKDWFARRRRRKAHWGALRAEMQFCRDLAEVYEAEEVVAPLYRLPTTAY